LSRQDGPQDRQTEAHDVAFGVAFVCGRVGVAAGRLALLPVRIAVRSPIVGPVLHRAGATLAAEGRTARVDQLDRLDAVVDQVLGSPEAERVINHALASPLPETIVRSLLQQHVAERVVEQLFTSTELETAIAAALERAETERLVRETLSSPGFERLATSASESLLASRLPENVVESPEMQRLIVEVASSPAVRGALMGTTSTLASEVSTGLSRRMETLDDAGEQKVRGWFRRSAESDDGAASRSGYGGLGGRGVAFGVDLGISTLLFLVGAALGAFVAWLAGGKEPGLLATLLAAGGWAVITAAYLVVFWTITGQTPGMRLMHLRVVDQRGRPPHFVRAVVRLIGLFFAILPLFAGFVPVLFDRRRRALQDFMASTVVRTEHEPPPEDEPTKSVEERHARKLAHEVQEMTRQGEGQALG
jgi:uncharacterized RDD family membrane protein YckC